RIEFELRHSEHADRPLWLSFEDRAGWLSVHLRQRGWLAAAGTLTPAGRAARDAVEARTDELALPPWSALGDDACARFHQLAWPLSDRIVASGGIPMPNPTGVSWQ
ncbi:MAG: helix-turn-helix domain-containing protein, partial [Ktedonobacterales bacterium]